MNIWRHFLQRACMCMHIPVCTCDSVCVCVSGALMNSAQCWMGLFWQLRQRGPTCGSEINAPRCSEPPRERPIRDKRKHRKTARQGGSDGREARLMGLWTEGCWLKTQSYISDGAKYHKYLYTWNWFNPAAVITAVVSKTRAVQKSENLYLTFIHSF